LPFQHLALFSPWAPETWPIVFWALIGPGAHFLDNLWLELLHAVIGQARSHAHPCFSLV
jgi:hypothetical protein